MPSSAAELNKLKVADLKELLKARNLPQTGKKDELVQRLLEAESGDAAPPQPAQPAAPAEPTPAPQPAAQPPAPQPAAAQPAEPAPPKPAPEPTPAAPAEPAAPQAEPEPAGAPTPAQPSGAEAPASQELTEQQRREQRAARFGVPLVQPPPKGAADPKVEERRKRFGVVEPADGGRSAGGIGGGPGKKQLSAEALEKIKKRQERFGAVGADEAEAGGGAQKKRQKGEGGEPAAAAPPMSEEMKAKLEARAKRFGGAAAPQ